MVDLLWNNLTTLPRRKVLWKLLCDVFQASMNKVTKLGNVNCDFQSSHRKTLTLKVNMISHQDRNFM